MTDTTGVPPMASQAPSKPLKLVKLRIALGMLPQPSGKPPYIWVERWNSFIIGIIIGVGLPLLAWSGIPYETKKTILIWYSPIWLIFFFYFEGRELIGQMMGRGTIKQEQLSEQQNTSQDPFYGTIFAISVWAVVLGVHVALKPLPEGWVVFAVIRNVWSGIWTTPVYYGFVEWFILFWTWVGTSRINYIMYNVGNTFSKSAPMGERSVGAGH